jgi:hypothetical protein
MSSVVNAQTNGEDKIQTCHNFDGQAPRVHNTGSSHLRLRLKEKRKRKRSNKLTVKSVRLIASPGEELGSSQDSRLTKVMATQTKTQNDVMMLAIRIRVTRKIADPANNKLRNNSTSMNRSVSQDAKSKLHGKTLSVVTLEPATIDLRSNISRIRSSEVGTVPITKSVLEACRQQFDSEINGSSVVLLKIAMLFALQAIVN